MTRQVKISCDQCGSIITGNLYGPIELEIRTPCEPSVIAGSADLCSLDCLEDYVAARVAATGYERGKS